MSAIPMNQASRISAEERLETGAEQLTPSFSEWAGVRLICAAFLAFNLATYSYYPAVWIDEVSFAEPAVNLVKYGAFTTTVFQFQPFNTFPVVNCPLYMFCLAPWLTMAGTTVLVVRSF